MDILYVALIQLLALEMELSLLPSSTQNVPHLLLLAGGFESDSSYSQSQGGGECGEIKPLKVDMPRDSRHGAFV